MAGKVLAENCSKPVDVNFQEYLHCSDVSHSFKIFKKSLRNSKQERENSVFVREAKFCYKTIDENLKISPTDTFC